MGADRQPVGPGTHGYLRFDNCLMPADHLFGPEGSGFEIAQKRLGDCALNGANRHGQERRAGWNKLTIADDSRKLTIKEISVYFCAP